LDALGEIEEWRLFALTPRTGGSAAAPAQPVPPSKPDPQAGAATIGKFGAARQRLDLFDEALDEAAEALDARHEAPLEGFWRAVKAVLRLKPMRLPDGRRNVVHVIGPHEARQWVLPVVFVCGLVEKLFPHSTGRTPSFPMGARAP